MKRFKRFIKNSMSDDFSSDKLDKIIYSLNAGDVEYEEYEEAESIVEELEELVKIIQSHRHYTHSKDWFDDTDGRDREGFQEELNEYIKDINNILDTNIKYSEILPSRYEEAFMDSSSFWDSWDDYYIDEISDIKEKTLNKFDVEDVDDLEEDDLEKFESLLEDKLDDFRDRMLEKSSKYFGDLKESFNNYIEYYIMVGLEDIYKLIKNKESYQIKPTGAARLHRLERGF